MHENEENSKGYVMVFSLLFLEGIRPYIFTLAIQMYMNNPRCQDR